MNPNIVFGARAGVQAGPTVFKIHGNPYKRPTQQSTNIIPKQEPILPTKTEMAKNIIASTAKIAKSVLAGENPKLSAEEAKARLEICKGCEFFRQADERCSKCGCYMAVKTYLKAEKCPLNRW